MMIICEGAFSGIEGIIYFIYVSFNKIIDSLPGVMFFLFKFEYRDKNYLIANNN